MAGVVAVLSAEGAEVEFVSVVDDEEGGVSEVHFLQAIEEFLEQRGGALGADDDIASEVRFGEQGVSHAGSACGLNLFDFFLGTNTSLAERSEVLLIALNSGVDLVEVSTFGEESAHDAGEFGVLDRILPGFGELGVGLIEFGAERFFFDGGFAGEFAEPVPGGLAADGFDASHAGGDGSFGFDFEEADVFGVGDVGATAEFHGVAVEGFVAAADLHDANEVAVFVAEELHDVFVVLYLGVWDFDPRDEVTS